MDKGFKALAKAVKKDKDDFAIGSVVRFTGGGKYTYAVIKTPIGWVSTSRYDNGFVPQVMTFEKLTEIIARVDTTDIAVATEWKNV